MVRVAQRSPQSPSILELAGYLGFLFREGKLSPSSVKGHRAAIITLIRQLGGPFLSDDPLLRGVVRGISSLDARSPRSFPAWDLYVVLDSLRRDPYEPFRDCSLLHLSEKTAFLISFATGRRCSEVHAFSHQGVACETYGSISLRFFSGFLAKNQSAGTQAPSVFVRSRCAILSNDDEDRTLCRSLTNFQSCRSLYIDR